MKLSFSARGWPDLSWDELMDIVSENGFDGIETYHISAAPQLFDKGGPFHMYSIASTYRTLMQKKLTIPCFDTSLDIATADDEVKDIIKFLIIK